MNSIILLLLIQSGLLLLLPFFGMIFVWLFKENQLHKKIFSIIVSVIIVGFAISSFAIFIHGLYFANIAMTGLKITIPIFMFYTYSFEFGLQISLVQSILYLTAMFVLSIILTYFSWNKPYWKIQHSSKLTLYALTSIFLIFSPNLFQVLFFVIISDVFLIEIVRSVVLKSQKIIPNSLRKMIASFLIGDIFLVTASVIFARLAHSLDFSLITSKVYSTPQIFSNQIQLIVSLVLLAIIIKNSLMPFHMWIGEICSSNKEVIFAQFSVQFMTTISFIFITPIYQLLQLQGSEFYIWFGFILTLIGSVLSLFMRKELEIHQMITMILSGFLIFALGMAEMSIAIHLVVTLPLISISLIPYLFRTVKKDENESSNQKSNFTNIFLRFNGLFIITYLIMGIAPFTSLLLIPIQLLKGSIVFLIFFGFVFVALFYIIFQIYRLQISNASKIEFSVLEFIYTGFIVIFIGLSSCLYPSFNLLNPFIFPPIIALDLIWIPLVAIFSSCLIVLVVYLLLRKYSPDNFERFSALSSKIGAIARRFYNYDFIYNPIGILWIKGILPVFIWFKTVFIKQFLFEFIILNIWKFCIIIIKWTGKTIKDTIVPSIVRLFKSISNFIHKLEIANLRVQLQLVLISFSVLVVLIIILYSGGII